MTAKASAADFLPNARSLRALRAAARDCRGCPLWRDATQIVFGSGPRSADLMLVGEQPGDREDREGKPFVGPAGRILAEALEEAGIDPEAAYVTNAVKHFKWRPRGRRRSRRSRRGRSSPSAQPLPARCSAPR
jgi:DNA polymerase